VPLEGQWARQRTPLGHRERVVAWLTVAVLAAGAIAIPLAVHGAPAPARGCVNATIASTTGGAAIHACGDAARRMCAAADLPATVQEPCRRAGL
jgi:hypothetical protein